MQRHFGIVFSILILMAAGCTQKTGSSTDEQSLSSKAATQSNLIILSDGPTLGRVASELAKQGGSVARELEFAKGLVANVPAQALNGLKHKFPNAEFIEDVAVQLIEPFAAKGKPGGGTVPTPPAQVTPWGISAIRADSAHSVSSGAGVTVCVVDTGIDRVHPDLKNNVIGGRNFIAAKGRLDPLNFTDDNGHGTHVSGIIAAEDNSIGTIGVAPKAKLYGVKVLDARGSGSLSGVVDGINECIRAHAHVINMSLGATVSPASSSGVLMQAAVNAAKAAGIEVVVAAGNEGQDIANTIPAGLNNLIAVSAVDINGDVSSWSNFGLSAGDFAAPGVSIYSTWKGGGYDTISGTSMASPHVAGVAALRISAGKVNYRVIDLELPAVQQGSGLIDALGTVQ